MRTVALTLALLIGSPLAFAQEPPATDPSAEALHDELRAIRDEILTAIERNDFDAVEPHLHPNVVFTPMNGSVSRGPAEVRAYFDEMLQGPDSRVENIRLELTVDRLTDLYDNVGLAFGDSSGTYALRSGMDFTIRNRWTCALVREGGRWRIIAFHASADVFDNPVLDLAKRQAALLWGGVALVIGLAVGALVAGLLGRRRRR